MEELLTNAHGTEALVIALALNILMFVGKYLLKLFDKKRDQAEKNYASLAEKSHKMSEEMARMSGSMERLQHMISSYMEHTIDLATKLGSAEKQVVSSAETLSEIKAKIHSMSRYGDDIDRMIRAIKWVAGPERWEEIKETILKDEFRR